MTTIIDAIESRSSTGRYDPQGNVSDSTIAELVRLATLAPSAYNLQNWRFIAARSDAAKIRLHAAAYGQQQVLDAAVTFVICGTLEAYRELADALQPSISQGIIGTAVADAWVQQATHSHRDNPVLQRDEALRSASLAAMTLMLAAQGMGLSSGAMSGFDPQAVSQAFHLQAHELPVMLVTVGQAAAGNWPQKPRRAVAEVLELA
ncbi:nitroreductase family protein [Pokkaliibacter sp. MBI-7]|uniref:nitroreductase family protein n=1 Tax=Pokkaliibacter sp. MBI-7 TaxID=3040600 RepID=UPI0024473315|nr:nitroreductase family protein [Pokkaliibacter sp. MBI-7]MDH2432543.1 nitroreductase family protein [Pokkaliibacter sp. MBI-7]